MPLRKKISSRRNSSSSDVTPNGKMMPVVLQKCDLSCLQDKQRRSSTRSDCYTSTEDDKLRDGRARRGSTGSTSTKGIARVRKSSRDCVIPEDIELDIGDTPMLTIQDCGYVDMKHGSRPIRLQRIRGEEKDCISIQELSESPHRYGMRYGADFAKRSDDQISRLSDGEHMTFHPSSPLLVAMRTAVDSLNQYEDFEILEEIGAGFFAQVFKVSLLHLSLQFSSWVTKT